MSAARAGEKQGRAYFLGFRIFHGRLQGAARRNLYPPGDDCVQVCREISLGLRAAVLRPRC